MEVNPVISSNVYHPCIETRINGDGTYATVHDALDTTKPPSLPPPDAPPMETMPVMTSMPEYEVVKKVKEQKRDNFDTAQTTPNLPFSEAPPIPTLAMDYEKPVVRSRSLSNPADSTVPTCST